MDLPRYGIKIDYIHETISTKLWIVYDCSRSCARRITMVHNEILSIIEELHEADLIIN